MQRESESDENLFVDAVIPPPPPLPGPRLEYFERTSSFRQNLQRERAATALPPSLVEVYAWVDDTNKAGVLKSLTDFSPFFMNTQKTYTKDQGVSIFKCVKDVASKNAIIVIATSQFMEVNEINPNDASFISPAVEYVFFSESFKDDRHIHAKLRNVCYVKTHKLLKEHIGSIVLTKTLEKTGLNDML